MNCPRCQTTNPAEARFCLNCGLALTRKCASCNSDLLPGARFCMHCGHPVLVATPFDDSRFARAAAAAPARLAQKVRAASHLTGERRVVTILFVDVVGSTSLAERLEVETWTQVMSEAVDRLAPAIYRYEGTIARLLGDSILAFFGAPVAHEDDPARAVRAAIDVIAEGQRYAGEVRARLGVDFALRATINTGTVVIHAVSEDLHYEFTAMGGAVNLPSRIKFAAEAMTVVISEYTYRFVEPLFSVEPLPPVAVKGREQPVKVYRVLNLRAQPGPTRGLVGLHSPMVGRQAELKTLLSLCDTVRAGLGRAVLVLGEPGLGKTRLIAEWKALVESQAHQPAALWAEGRCLSYGQRLAYNLLNSLVHSLIGVSESAEAPQTQMALQTFCQTHFGPDDLSVYPSLGHLLGLKLEGQALAQVQSLDPQSLQQQYVDALRQVFQVVSARRPLVLVLEDLHWADPSSVDLFMRLLPAANASAMLFCLVTREERDTAGWRLVTAVREMLGSSLAEISLRALSETESRQLVANLLAIEALPEAVRKVILKKSEGNPFFVEEVIRMLIDRGAILRQDNGWVAADTIDQVDIPDNLQGLLLARIDRLPEESRQILRVAAVIGRQFPVQVLEQVLLSAPIASE